MSLTKEEMLELALDFGAVQFDINMVIGVDKNGLLFNTKADFLAYTSAIEQNVEQKYQAQIAELRDGYLRIRSESINAEFIAEEMLSATQATADAWEAEVKASVLEDIRDRIPPSTCRPFSKRSEGYDDAINEVHGVIDSMAAELRNQQPEQPRKPCTCDGWCDGLCLEKEGNRK